MAPTCAFSLVTKLQSWWSWTGQRETNAEEGSVCGGRRWRPSHESQEADGRNVLSCHTCWGPKDCGGGDGGRGGLQPKQLNNFESSHHKTDSRKYSNVSPSILYHLHVFHSRCLHFSRLSNQPQTHTYTHTLPTFVSLLLIITLLWGDFWGDSCTRLWWFQG